MALLRRAAAGLTRAAAASGATWASPAAPSLSALVQHAQVAQSWGFQGGAQRGLAAAAAAAAATTLSSHPPAASLLQRQRQALPPMRQRLHSAAAEASSAAGGDGEAAAAEEPDLPPVYTPLEEHMDGKFSVAQRPVFAVVEVGGTQYKITPNDVIVTGACGGVAWSARGGGGGGRGARAPAGEPLSRLAYPHPTPPSPPPVLAQKSWRAWTSIKSCSWGACCCWGRATRR